MTYKLHNRLGSGGFAVEVALTLASQPFELILHETTPGTPMPEAFRDVNPWNQVPFLITPEGEAVSESAAMLIYIATVHPSAALGPAPGTREYAGFVRWLVFLSANVYEAILRKGYPERFTTDPQCTSSVVEAAVRRNQEAFRLIEEHLQPGKGLVGAELSLADIYMAMLYAWHPETDQCPKCTALTHRVAAHPVIASIWQRNFDHRLKRKWGRDIDEP